MIIIIGIDEPDQTLGMPLLIYAIIVVFLVGGSVITNYGNQLLKKKFSCFEQSAHVHRVNKISRQK